MKVKVKLIQSGILILLSALWTSGQALSSTGIAKNFLIPITVSDKNGSVKSLSADDVEIFENNQRINILSLTRSNDPYSIGILIDLSGSIGGPNDNRLRLTLQKLGTLIRESTPNTEYFLAAIQGDRPHASEPSRNVEILLKTLNAIVELPPKGNTRLYDSLQASIERLASLTSNRKALIVVTDGVDSASKLADFGNISRLVRQHSILIYCLNISSPADLTSSLGQNGDLELREFSKLSGGRVYYPLSQDEKKDWVAELSDEMRNIYYAEIRLTESREKIRWREIKVQLSKEAKKRLGTTSLTARKGVYF